MTQLIFQIFSTQKAEEIDRRRAGNTIKEWTVMEFASLTREAGDKTSPEVIKKISCSTQLSMKFFLLINVKMPTIVGVLTFMSRNNSILGLCEPEKR